MITGHGGNIFSSAARLGCDPGDIIDMSSNVNPMGPPPGLMDFLRENLSLVRVLPEPDAATIRKRFSRPLGLSPENVLAGNGTTQFIHALPEVLGTKKALILGPTYSDYADACLAQKVPYRIFLTLPEENFIPNPDRLRARLEDADTVYICNPNNPTGNLIDGEHILALTMQNPHIRFIVDESYLPFVPFGERYSLAALHRNSGPENLIVLNSMSKIFRIPGLRIGFVIASKKTIERFFHRYHPWCVNSLAQAAVNFLMQHPELTRGFVFQSRRYLEKERENFVRDCSGISGLRIFPSLTSFFLIQLQSMNSETLCERLLQKRILIRNCSNFEGLSSEFVRISLKTSRVNQMAARALVEIMDCSVQG